MLKINHFIYIFLLDGWGQIVCILDFTWKYNHFRR